MWSRMGTMLTGARFSTLNRVRTMAPRARMEFERRATEIRMNTRLVVDSMVETTVNGIADGLDAAEVMVEIAKSDYLAPMQGAVGQLLADASVATSQTVFPEFYDTNSEVGKEFYDSFIPEFDRIEGGENGGNGEKNKYVEKAKSFVAEKGAEYLKLIRWIAAITFIYEFYQGWKEYEEEQKSKASQEKDEYKIGDEEFFGRFPEALDKRFDEFVTKCKEEFTRVVGDLPYNREKSDLKEDLVNQEFGRVADSMMANVLDGLNNKIESKVNDKGEQLSAQELEELQMAQSFAKGCAVAVKAAVAGPQLAANAANLAGGSLGYLVHSGLDHAGAAIGQPLISRE